MSGAAGAALAHATVRRLTTDEALTVLNSAVGATPSGVQLPPPPPLEVVALWVRGQATLPPLEVPLPAAARLEVALAARATGDEGSSSSSSSGGEGSESSSDAESAVRGVPLDGAVRRGGALRNFLASRAPAELTDLLFARRLADTVSCDAGAAAVCDAVQRVLPEFFVVETPRSLWGAARAAGSPLAVAAPLLLKGHDVALSLRGGGVGAQLDLLGDAYDVATHRQLEATGRDAMIPPAAVSKGVVLAALLMPLVLHVNFQPVLEPGEGPRGLVLCPTRALCDDATAFVAQLAAPTHLVVHNTLRTAPLIPDSRRADIVVSTPAHLREWCWIASPDEAARAAPATSFVYSLRRVSFVAVLGLSDIVAHGMAEHLRTLCALSPTPPPRADAASARLVGWRDTCQKAFLLSARGDGAAVAQEQRLCRELMRRPRDDPPVYAALRVAPPRPPPTQSSALSCRPAPSATAKRERQDEDAGSDVLHSVAIFNALTCGELSADAVGDLLEGALAALEGACAAGGGGGEDVPTEALALPLVRAATELRVHVLPVNALPDEMFPTASGTAAVADYLGTALGVFPPTAARSTDGGGGAATSAPPAWCRDFAIVMELALPRALPRRDATALVRLSAALLDGRRFAGHTMRAMPLGRELSCSSWPVAIIAAGSAPHVTLRTSRDKNVVAVDDDDEDEEDGLPSLPPSLAALQTDGGWIPPARVPPELRELPTSVGLRTLVAVVAATSAELAKSGDALLSPMLPLEAEVVRECAAFGRIALSRPLASTSAARGVCVVFEAPGSALECWLCLSGGGSAPLLIFGCVPVRLSFLPWN